MLNHPTSAPPKMKAPVPVEIKNSRKEMIQSGKLDNHRSNAMLAEQQDRSLTVIIPRVKYHSTVFHAQAAAQLPLEEHHQQKIITSEAQIPFQNHFSRKLSNTITATSGTEAMEPICPTTEAKLLSYLDASPSKTKV